MRTVLSSHNARPGSPLLTAPRTGGAVARPTASFALVATTIALTTLAALPTASRAQKTGRLLPPAPGGAASIAITPDTSAQALAKLMDVSVDVAKQIMAVQADKESWTLAQQKLDSDYIYGARLLRGQEAVPGVPTTEIGARPDSSGNVIAVIVCNRNAGLFQAITAMGGVITDLADASAVTARLPLLQLETLAERGDVFNIHRPYEPRLSTSRTGREALARIQSRPLVPYLRKKRTDRERTAAIQALLASKINPTDLSALLAPLRLTTGSKEGEGDVTHQADLARTTYNINGKGLRIGILSDGDKYLAASQAAGDLPATDATGTGSGASVTIVNDDTPGGGGAQDGPSSNAGEGTAMMEIVADVAPGSKIFFASAFNSFAQFAKNIELLRYKYHCDIIVDDVSYPTGELVFSDGPIAQAVNNVVADGALYFSSSGNEGHFSSLSLGGGNTSSAWQGDFVDSGSNQVITGTTLPGTLNAFNNGAKNPYENGDYGTTPTYGQVYNRAAYPEPASGTGNPVVGTTRANVLIQWADKGVGATNDYDLYVTDAGGTSLRNMSTTVQNGGSSTPVEALFYNGVPNSTTGIRYGDRVYILKKSGSSSVALYMTTEGGRFIDSPALSFSTTGQTYGHAAAAPSALAYAAGIYAFGVAATPARAADGYGGPYPNAFSTSSKSEYFSSDGPRQVFFDVAGGPNLDPASATGTDPRGGTYTIPVSAPVFTSFNGINTFASGGGTTRNEPCITAADGVGSGTAIPTNSGLNPFYGTSAAAPHAGAIAALIKSYAASGSGLTINGYTLSVPEMHSVMQNSALVIESANTVSGFNPTTGAGIVMPIPEIQYLQNFLNPNSISASALSTTSATITWTTNLTASSTVQYGTTTAYGATMTGSSGTAHSVTLNGLMPGTIYHYKVSSVTPTSSLSYTDTGDRTFVTSSVASPPSVNISALSGSRSGSNVTYTVTLRNSGGSTATGVMVTRAKVGSATAPTQTLPISVGDIAAGGTAIVTLTFANPGSAGAATVLTVYGTMSDGSSFSNSARVTLP